MNFLVKAKMPGLVAAFKASGIQVCEWPDGLPAFDVFHRLVPDVLIVESGQLDRATEKCLEKYNTVLVTVTRSLDGTGLYLPPAADTIRFRPGEFRQEFECGVAYVADYKDTYAPILDFCLKNPNANVKIFGDGWDTPLCLGRIADDDLPDLYYTAKSCGRVDDQDRMMDITICGGRNYPGPCIEAILEGQTWFDNLIIILNHLNEPSDVKKAKDLANRKWASDD